MMVVCHLLPLSLMMKAMLQMMIVFDHSFHAVAIQRELQILKCHLCVLLQGLIGGQSHFHFLLHLQSLLDVQEGWGEKLQALRRYMDVVVLTHPLTMQDVVPAWLLIG